MARATSAEQHALVERLRTLLPEHATTREVSMFGGHAFMVNGKLALSAHADGSLLARVPTRNHDELLVRDGASVATMGAGRSMSAGWIRVAPSGIASDETLADWVGIALDHNNAVT